MNSKGTEYRNLILISQVSISVMVPIFVCLALGVWLSEYIGTWFTMLMLVLGIAAGARNAYVLLSSLIKSDEERRIKKQEEDIKRKVENANRGKADKEVR